MGNTQHTTRMDVRRWLPFGIMALVLIAGARPAGAESAGVSDSALGPEAEQRYARGEAFYEGEWMPVETLFEKYCQQRDHLRDLREHGDHSRDQLNGLQREIARIREEQREEEQPIRLRLGKIRHQLREYNHFLRQEPPAEPVLLHLPLPARSTLKSENRYVKGLSRTQRRLFSRAIERLQRQENSRMRHDWAYRARQAWVRRCKQIEKQNEMKVKQYRTEIKEYQKQRKAIKQEVPKLEAEAKKLEKQLEAIEKKYENKIAAAGQQSETMSGRVQTHYRRVDLIERKVEEMAEALSAVPEEVLCQHGIAAFEGQFQSVEDLRRRYKRRQRKIDHAHERLQVECEELGIPFPDNWRHPQQDRMDKIKALIVKAKQARDATG